MILGIGLDVVNIERMKHWKDDAGILKRYFHPDEIAGARARYSMELPSLAARFAAKEAFGKAIGTGLAGFALKEVCVLNQDNGRPVLRLYGRAKEALRTLGGARTFVSLTHEHDYAHAVVVIEGD